MNAKRAGTLFALTLTAGTLGVAGSASAAECGAPAVDAVYDTVSHPAATHVESRWTRTVIDTPAQEAWTEPDVVVPDSYITKTVVVKEAWDEVRVVTPAYDQVIVTPGRDAVYVTQYVWKHKQTHEERWEAADWNGESHSTSWQITGKSREWLVSPAVPETTEVVHHPEVTEVVHHEAVTKEVEELVPGYTVPGKHHAAVPEVSHVERKWAVQSPGDGWADSGETRVVVDRAAYDEQVLVTPAQPAGPECPTDPDGDGGGVEVVEPAKGAKPAKPANSDRTDGTDTARQGTRTTSQASAVPARLAHTGSDSAQYALVGVFLLAGGVALSVRARRLQD